MQYWRSIKDQNGFTYSCDMLRIVFSLRSDEVASVEKRFCNPLRMDVDIARPDFRDFKYRNLVTIKCNESSYTIGIGFNGTTKEDSLRCFLEVNPNKVFTSEEALEEIRWLLVRSTGAEVSRWDLAIDIPYERTTLALERDQRKYATEQTSRENITEYLGCRNQVGRVKLYNKTIESKLDYDLTRLEITMDGLDKTAESIRKYIPSVALNRPQREIIDLDGADLSGTQKVLVSAIRETDRPMYFLGQLTDRHLRKKIEPYVMCEIVRLQPCEKSIYEIVSYIRDIVKIGA